MSAETKEQNMQQAGVITSTGRFVVETRRRAGAPAPAPGARAGVPGAGVPGAGAGVAGRVPRVARLMALAIRFEQLLRSGAVSTQTDLAALAHVTRARVTQIMNLNHLAPDIQEEVLDSLTAGGRDRVTEHELREIVALVLWADQREAWRRLRDRGVGRGEGTSLHS